MKRRPDPAAADLEASLARLGVRELEERMELSPLLTAGDVQDSDFCQCSCTCEDLPPDPDMLERLKQTLPSSQPTF